MFIFVIQQVLDGHTNRTLMVLKYANVAAFVTDNLSSLLNGQDVL